MDPQVVPLDEALEMVGFGRFHVGILVLSGTVLIGMIFETLGLGYIIPAAQCDLNLALGQKGWLAAIPFIGIIVSGHMWGWLADTQGRRPVMVVSMAVGSTLSILSSFCPDLWSYAALRMVAAIFISGPSGVAYAYLGEFNSPRYRDRMVTIGASFISVGCVILPAVAWLIYPTDFRVPIAFLGLEYRPWRLLVVFCALPYLVCTLVMARAPESPKFLASIGKTEEAMRVIRMMYQCNQGKQMDKSISLEYVKPASMQTSVLTSIKEQTIPLFQKPLRFYSFIACLVQLGVFSCANGFYIWFPEIWNRIGNHENADMIEGKTVCEILSIKPANTNTGLHNLTAFNLTQCDDSVNTSTFQRAVIMGCIFSPIVISVGFVVNLLGKRNMLIGLTLVCGCSALLIHWVTDTNVSLALFYIFQLCGACIGLMNAYVVELYPTHLRAMAVCLSLMSGRIGSIIGSTLIGVLIEVYCPSSFFLFGGLLVLCCGACIMLPKPRKA